MENRPLNYIGDDRTNAEITAIAWAFSKGSLDCRLLGQDDPSRYLAEFRETFVEAEIVTGHFILGHDLRLLNGAMLEYGFKPLPQKLVSDTWVHLKKRAGVSASQESLASILNLPIDKFHMTQPMWRSANRLQPEGLTLTRKRVSVDVLQHIYLRKALLEKGWLKGPTWWKP